MIPRNIFQTHKSLEYVKSDKRLFNAVQSWRKSNFSYFFFNDKQMSNFMEICYPDIKPLYDRLPLTVMKADLWRYCVIYKYGGIYADVDTILNINPNIFINNKLLVVAPENNVHFCQYFFAAPPNSPVLKCVIDLAVERITNTINIKGEHITHYLTGPAVFTDGIIKYLKSQNINVPTDDDFMVYHPTTYGRLKEGNIFRYENICNNIEVINYDKFINRYIKHLFSGSWKDGWTKERDKLLK